MWSTQDASAMLAQQAARLLDQPEMHGASRSIGKAPSTLTTLARCMGVSERHVRRIFEAQFGVSPLQYLQTRRLLNAKQLLTDTRLPVTTIALSSGFGSVRRFNAAFVQHYGLNPSGLRRARTEHSDAGVCVRLGYRPPYDVRALLDFYDRRSMASVEFVQSNSKLPRLGKTLRLEAAGKTHCGWLLAEFDEARHQLVLRVSDGLREVLPQVIARVRACFDLDADPQAINPVLHRSFPLGDGLRVPGALDGFELAVRAVLGQQITVAAARTLAQRLVNTLGEPMATPWPALSRLFPSAATLAQTRPDTLGQLGIVKQRQMAIVALARAVAEQRIQLQGGADVSATMAALKELPGFGDWTAHYIAMRALRWPDAFPAADVALHKALGLQGQPHAARQALAASLAWQPWRSYAVIRAWSSLS
jgi:AraC family transcriptional regulator of adaptative response / DNA-3-methyladenine glycosylase II